MHSTTITAFGITVEIIYQPLSIPNKHQHTIVCDSQQCYLAIPSVARYLARPTENRIYIEKANADVSDQMIAQWLYGTVFAYILQYHSYLVLHGSAVLMHEGAVIFSGDSGAGKSTLAAAMNQKGYALITDDLVVIHYNQQGQAMIIPGPAKIKLCSDAVLQLHYDEPEAKRIHEKHEKYEIPIHHHTKTPALPVTAFYELNPQSHATQITMNKLNNTEALKTLIKNTYRYFMIEKLGTTGSFLKNCVQLAEQITMYQMTRPAQDSFTVPQLITQIEHEQQRKLNYA